MLVLWEESLNSRMERRGSRQADAAHKGSAGRRRTVLTVEVGIACVDNRRKMDMCRSCNLV